MCKISQINSQGIKIKAFSFLELMISILLIGIISSFAIPYFLNINDKTSFMKLKSQYTFVLNGLAEYKSKKILLGIDISNLLLDDANIEKEDEKLFSNVIDVEILSTNSSINEKEKWVKKSDEVYSFVLDKDSFVDFKFENGNFNCISDFELCKGLQ